MKSISLNKPSRYDSEIMPRGMSGDKCPCVCLNGSAELADLPDEGLITFKFKRTSATVLEDGKMEVNLKLCSIEDASEEASGEEDDDTGTALDKLIAQASSDDEVE